MNGRQAKKLRRLVRKSEIALSERAFYEFKTWVRQLPLRHRAAVAWKVMTRSL